MSDQTVITTFEVTPGTCADLMDELRAAYAEFISHQQGFVRRPAARQRRPDPRREHLALARPQDFLAMLRTDEMRTRNRRISALCRSFEPVLYEAVAEFEAPSI